MAKNSAAFNIIFGAKTENLTKALRTVDTQLRQTAAKFNKIGRSMSLGVTAPLAAIGASSFRTAANFEQAMAKVQAVSGATAGEFTALSANARELGRTTRYSATEVAGLQLEFSKLGFTAAEIEKVTGATLALAQASGSDLAASAEVAGATLRAFGLDASETARVTDVMAASFSGSALDLESFQDSMKYVAPVAKAAGVSLEEASALLAVLANNGIKGSQAGTSLRRILQDLSGQGLDFSEAMKMSAEEVVNLADAKDEVGRTASSAFLVLKDGAADVERLTGAFQTSEGAAAAMAATMDATAQGSIAKMRSALEGAQITIGEALAPIVLRLVERVEGLATAFSNMSETGQTVVLAMAGLAAGVGPVASGIGSLLGVVRQVAPAIRKMSLALSANPYLLAAAAIAAVAVAIYQVATRTEEATEAQKRVKAASDRAADSYATEAGKVEALATQYRLAGDDLEQKQRILGELQKISPAYFGNLDAEKTSYQDLSTAVGDYSRNLRKLAIQKAFAEELTAIEVERVKAAEELYQAQQAVAEAINAQQTAIDERGDGLFDGYQVTLTTRARAEADGAVLAIRRRMDELAEASANVQAKIDRANAALNELGGADVGSLLRDLERIQPAPVPVKVKPDLAGLLTELEATPAVAPVQFSIQGGPLEQVMEQLGDELREAASLVTLDGDQLQYLQAQAAAYQAAAVSAQSLGESNLAAQLYQEATAAEALALAMERTAARTADAYNAAELLGFSLTKLSQGTTGDLLTALNSYGTTTEENTQKTKTWQESAEELGATIGNTIGNAFSQAASGAMTMADALKAAGRQILATLLAESLSLAITNAFQTAKASGPAAAILGPTLAAAGSAAVYGLFNKIPALAEGGITTGPTLALIGDNPGGQEVVMPLDRLRSMMSHERGGGSVTVRGRLSGRDLLISGQRSQRYTERTGAL